MSTTGSDGAVALMEAWLEGLSALRGASPRTIEAYRRDVAGFLGFQTRHQGGPMGRAALARIGVRDMRAWMADARARDLSPRTVARSLSAVKSFYRWLADRHGVDAPAVSGTRGPRLKPRLPRPVDPGAAKAVLDLADLQHPEPWIGARDLAVLTLLYGCGLRISEALSLAGRDLPIVPAGDPETDGVTACGSPARVASSGWFRCCPSRGRQWTPILGSVPTHRSRILRFFAAHAAVP